MIWHEHVLAIATAAGKKLGYLFRDRNYFPPSNILITLYKAQIRPCLEYCSHIWGDTAPPTLSLLDTVKRRAIRLIGDLALTASSNRFLTGRRRRAVSDLLLFCRYSNGVCSSELTSIVSPITLPARCTPDIYSLSIYN
nr:unnamed protein product [Callosobruchus chinensis]